VAKELVGEAFAGILVSDRWPGYRWVPLTGRQLCWAHLIREFCQMAEAGGSAGAIGETLGMCARQLFHWWHRVRDGTLQRSSFCVYAAQLRMEVRALLREGASCEDAKGAALCRSLLKHEPALWTFVYHEGVEPTNNPAEVRLVGQKPNIPNVWGIGPGTMRDLSRTPELDSCVGVIPTILGEGLRHMPHGSDWSSIREAGMNVDKLRACLNDATSRER
jgi:transposase-like protein